MWNVGKLLQALLLLQSEAPKILELIGKFGGLFGAGQAQPPVAMAPVPELPPEVKAHFQAVCDHLNKTP